MPPISDVKLLDCMEGMAAYPDKFFSLALVDPPYGIGQGALKVRSRSFKKDGTPIVKFDKRSGSQILVKDRQYGHGYFDNEAPGVEYFEELRRVSKNQIIWGANHFISKIPFDSSCWIVWNKINGETDQADSELALPSWYPNRRMSLGGACDYCEQKEIFFQVPLTGVRFRVFAPVLVTSQPTAVRGIFF